MIDFSVCGFEGGEGRGGRAGVARAVDCAVERGSIGGAFIIVSVVRGRREVAESGAEEVEEEGEEGAGDLKISASEWEEGLGLSECMF